MPDRMTALPSYGIRVNFDLENNFLFAGLTLFFHQNIWFDFYTIEKNEPQKPEGLERE